MSEFLPPTNELEDYHASVAVILSRARRHLLIFVSTFVISFLGLGLLVGEILLLERFKEHLVYVIIGVIGVLVVSSWSFHPNKTRSTEGMTHGVNRTKRLLDLSIVSILMVFYAPLLIVIALLIKITSPGPILFAQKRIGLNGRTFHLYKFRTMLVDKPDGPGDSEIVWLPSKAAIVISLVRAGSNVPYPDVPGWSNPNSSPQRDAFSLKGDLRITPIRITSIGAFLRRTSMDELPQLINILKGDMSLVGPWPIPAIIYKEMNQAQRRKRLSVLPGMTGLSQIRLYRRSSIPFKEWLKLNEQYIDQYIEHWSIWLDLKILVMTTLTVLRRDTLGLWYLQGESNKFEEVLLQRVKCV